MSAHSRALDVHQAIISRLFGMDGSGRTGSNDAEDRGA